VRRAGALLVLLPALMVGGCVQYYWSRPGGDLAQFERDSRECARGAAENPTAAAHGIVDQPRYRACLTAKGWTREKQMEPAPAGWYRGIE
jgi:hypothetical protein